MSVPSSSNKRNRVFNSSSSNNDSSDACGEDDKGKDFGDEEHHARMSKKPRGEEEEELQQQQQHQQQQENNVDSDSDYDDMLDDFAVPTDMDDYLDDEEVDDDDDDLSTTSTRTTMSTGSVGSNTPSVVGENLESFSLVEAGEKMAGGKNKEQQQLQVGGPVVKNTEPPLRRSLFPHVPPSINFVHHNEVPETPLPAELRKNLRWKLSNITPAVVKKVVTNSGFRLMRKSCSEWGGTWGKHMKSHLFKESISESQKINHFPGTFNIGRKDRLWKNYHKMRLKYGKEEFSFLPRTFCLPADAKLLRRVWEKRGIKAKWIIKPPAMARGTGIKVVNKWNQIPKSQPLIVQRYLARPHLINNTKYDLRIYVLMTSINPLRLYLYDEGLVRFASNKYTADNDCLSDVFMHLTNYSINKNSAAYTPNEDPEIRQGHKWTLASLWQHFSEAGIDHKPVWERIKDMVIKTVISAEHSMFPLSRTNLLSQYCGYELFGFDILLDADLKPWLIEVNISPSLHSASPLDLDVKSPLATEVFNIARYHVPNKISAKAQKQVLQKLNLEDLSCLCLDPRLYTRDVSKAEKSKQNRIMDVMATADNNTSATTPVDTVLERLTPDDVRQLIRAEDELAQLRHFSRIFPTQETHKYFQFFAQPRYYNVLYDAWEQRYGDCRSAGIDRLAQLCLEKVHLRVPATTSSSNSSSSATSCSSSSTSSKSMDLSMLKAPTGNAAESKPATEAPEKSVKPAATTGGIKKPSFVAKPLHMGYVANSSRTSNKAKSSSPEPMSVGGDNSDDAEDSSGSRTSVGGGDVDGDGENDGDAEKTILCNFPKTSSNGCCSSESDTINCNNLMNS